MGGLLSVIDGWKDLIIKVFTEQLFAGAIITLLAIPAWFWLEQKQRPCKTATNALLLLLAWAIAVPIGGGILWVLGKLLSFIETVAPPVAGFFGDIVTTFDKHPILVIALTCLAFAGYFGWKRWRPQFLPNRAVRFIGLAASVVIAAHIVGKVMDAFPEANTSPAVADTAAHTPSTKAPASTASVANNAKPAPPVPSSTKPTNSLPAPATTTPAIAAASSAAQSAKTTSTSP
ncbi:hypothetical protein [Pinirhizobacter soli]|uniref:hypothetical protein n=1 Tax=Pinirhizobacter soli TaxID=2786953 RepID=UPI00202ABFE4|nr:hypothetical protein [Pinirhizobacter soli]